MCFPDVCLGVCYGGGGSQIKQANVGGADEAGSSFPDCPLASGETAEGAGPPHT